MMYHVILTRDITESRTVLIEADGPKAAGDLAGDHGEGTGITEWAVDDNAPHHAYVTDVSEAKE